MASIDGFRDERRSDGAVVWAVATSPDFRTPQAEHNCAAK
jgi:hypothetical protein